MPGPTLFAPGTGPGGIRSNRTKPYDTSIDSTVYNTIVEVGSTTYTTANTATITTASFTPSDNSLLIALVGMGNGTGGASSLGTVTDSLGGSWTRLIGTAGTFGGVAEIWARDISTGASMTVTYDPGGPGASGLNIIVKWYSGAEAVAIQATAGEATSSSTPFNAAITTTRRGSIVVGSWAEADGLVTAVANSNTTIFGQFAGSSGDGVALFKSTNPTTSPNATVFGFTNSPTGNNFIALAEIIPTVLVLSEIDSGAIAFSANTTLVSAGSNEVLGISSLSVQSTMVAAGISTALGTSGLSIQSTMVTAATNTILATSVLSGQSTLTSAGILTRLGVAVLSGQSTLTVAGANTVLATSSLSSQSVLAAASVLGVLPTATLSSQSTLAAISVLTTNGAAVFTIGSVLFVSGGTVLSADAVFSGQSTLTAAGIVSRIGAAGFSIQATMNTNGSNYVVAASVLSAQSTLVSTAILTRLATATLTVQSTMVVAASNTVLATSVLSEQSALISSGFAVTNGSSALTIQSILVADGIIGAIPVTVTMTSLSNLVVAGSVVKNAQSTLTSQSGLVSSGIVTKLADSQWSVQGTLVTNGIVTVIAGSINPTIQSELVVSGVVAKLASASFSVQGTLSSLANNTVLTTSSLSGQSNVVTVPMVTELASAMVGGIVSMSTSAVLSRIGSAILSQNSSLVVLIRIPTDSASSATVSSYESEQSAGSTFDRRYNLASPERGSKSTVAIIEGG